MWEMMAAGMQIIGLVTTAVATIAIVVRVAKAAVFLKPLAAPVLKAFLGIEIARVKVVAGITNALLQLGMNQSLKIMKASGWKEGVYQALLTIVIFAIVPVMLIPITLRMTIVLVKAGEAARAKVISMAITEAKQGIRLKNHLDYVKAFYAKPSPSRRQGE